MSISIDDFVDFKPSTRMAGEHSDRVNKSLDAVLLFEGGEAKLTYVVNSNRPVAHYARTECLIDAIEEYNKI